MAPPSKSKGQRPDFCSIPGIAFIEFEIMAFAKFAELVLKRKLSVMFRLIPNIFVNGLAVRMAYGKSPVSSLPGESFCSTGRYFRPLRRFSFDELDEFRNGDCARKSNKQMYMINIAANRRADAIRLLYMMRQHAEHLRSKTLRL